jgi:exodeoxyribonuclease VII large subunit
VPVAEELRTQLQVLRRRLGRGMETEFRGCRLALERARTRLGDPRRLIDQKRQAADDLLGRGMQALRAQLGRQRTGLRALETRLLRAHPQRRIADQRNALVALERRLAAAAGTLLVRRRRALEGICGKVEALSPLKVLERGYSLTRAPDGRVIASVADVATGAEVRVILRDGELATRVEAVHATAQREAPSQEQPKHPQQPQKEKDP